MRRCAIAATLRDNMLRGALHVAVVCSFLCLPLNRRHNIVLVYPIEDVGVCRTRLCHNALQAAGAPRIQWDVLVR